MKPPEVVELLKEGVAAARRGDRTTARKRLLAAICEQADYEVPWLWLAWIAVHKDEASWFVHRALTINPQHQNARDWLHELQGGPLKATPWRCPFCGHAARERPPGCPSCKTLFVSDTIEGWFAADADRELVRATVAYLASPSGKTEHPSWHLTMGIAHLTLGNFSTALGHLRRATVLAPDDASTRRIACELELWMDREGSGSPAGAGVVAEARRTGPERSTATNLEAGGAAKPRGPGLERVALPTAQVLILVVDDSPTVRKIVAVTLESQGCRVLAAADGLQALSKLDEVVPDLVFLDITMPRLDGYRVCRFIKNNERTRHVPVIMLSGKDGFFDKVRGRMAGADDYITKPVDRNTLLRTVSQWQPKDVAS